MGLGKNTFQQLRELYVVTLPQRRAASDVSLHSANFSSLLILFYPIFRSPHTVLSWATNNYATDEQ